MQEGVDKVDVVADDSLLEGPPDGETGKTLVHLQMCTLASHHLMRTHDKLRSR